MLAHSVDFLNGRALPGELAQKYAFVEAGHCLVMHAQEGRAAARDKNDDDILCGETSKKFHNSLCRIHIHLRGQGMRSDECLNFPKTVLLERRNIERDAAGEVLAERSLPGTRGRDRALADTDEKYPLCRGDRADALADAEHTAHGTDFAQYRRLDINRGIAGFDYRERVAPSIGFGK